ncbi:MAG: response regulator, partial [Chloroflexi bacterium]|nr:response regulator [Chloroflexota bacterium]
EEQYRSIYDSLNDGVLNVGGNGEILGCNQAFATLTGYSPEALSSMSLQDLARPEWKDKVVASIHSILKGRYLEKVERALVNNEGIAVPVEMWSRALIQGASEPTSIFLIARDLRQEHQTQQVNRELAVMEERTRLAREIHDTVAQTLTALVNQLDTTEYLVPDGLEDLVQNIGEAKDIARACLSQTRSALLDLQPMELKPGGLTDGIRAEALGFQQRGLNVEVKVQGVEPVNANERSVLATFRIVQEALSNSYKHSKASTVTVELIYGPDDVVLQIVDDGIGFDVNAQRAKGQQGVTGFGMGVMDERSRVAGGELTIVSARGTGTRIIGRIPYSPSYATPIISLPEDTTLEDLSKLGTCRVLLVDDHELVRHGTKAWLEATDDMEVVGEADTGAWAIVKAQELEPDVILMDIHMPSMDGIEATRRIIEVLPDCKIILLTVYDDDDHVREGIRAGAKGYLVKGAAREEILNGIRVVFAGGSLVPASVLGSLAETPSKKAGPTVTAREREVLALLTSGAPTKEIAAALTVSENTVNYHLRNLYQKLGVKNRTQAIRASEAAGLLKTSTK